MKRLTFLILLMVTGCTVTWDIRTEEPNAVPKEVIQQAFTQRDVAIESLHNRLKVLEEEHGLPKEEEKK